MRCCSNLYWLSLKSQLEGILAKDAKEGSVFSVQKQAGGPSGYDLGLSSTTLLLFISDTLQYLLSHTDSTRLYCYFWKMAEKTAKSLFHTALVASVA